MLRLSVLAGLALSLAAGAASAQALGPVNGGKLLLTGGVSNVEGAGGGGLATWAVTTGYGAADGIGANAHATYLNLPDYEFRSFGVATAFYDRLELSYARQAFDTGKTGAKLGLGKGFTFHQDVVGAKLRVFGDAVYDQDAWTPQVAVGFQLKRNDKAAVLAAIGAESDTGTDVYVAATKLLLNESLVLSGAVRATKANQMGLLGFGGDRRDDYSLQVEGSAGYLVSRRLLVGAEYRTKPSNLGFAKEDDALDVFAAYALNKTLSVTVAYADLGDIATFEDQRGLYVSLQAGF
jgi:hypothetical protein